MANISQAERDKLPTGDFAGPHESFPIRNQQDVHDAARLIGHAADPAAVKARVIAIARRKGFDIPDAWKESAGKAFMGSPFALSVPITKVDLVQHIVYGVAALEQVDKSGEIFDYASSKPHFQAWTSDFSKRTGGKSKGNVREMHRDVAAGKLTILNFNDADKQVEVAAKVVDDAAWEKVQEGVYTGFSIGGSYANKWNDPGGKGLRYTAKPSEISLVDNPCMPGATFTAVKSDGTSEVRKFATTKEITVDSEKEITNETDEIVEKADDSSEIAYDDGRPIDADFAASADVHKDDGGDMAMAAGAGAKSKGNSANDAEDAADDADDDDDDESAANKAKKDAGYMAMSTRLDGLEKAVVGIGSLLEKLDARLSIDNKATETPAEKLDKIEEPKDGEPLAKMFETQREELRKATEVITQLEARLQKIENEPVPGGPFLTGEAMEKAAKLGLLSVADKTLSTDSGTSTSAGAFDPANKSQVVATLTKMQADTTDPFRKEELGKILFELQFREGLGGN